jgi:hypothetical protein
MPNYCHLAFYQDFAATLSDFLTLQLSRDYSSAPSLYALLCEKMTQTSHTKFVLSIWPSFLHNIDQSLKSYKIY